MTRDLKERKLTSLRLKESGVSSNRFQYFFENIFITITIEINEEIMMKIPIRYIQSHQER